VKKKRPFKYATAHSDPEATTVSGAMLSACEQLAGDVASSVLPQAQSKLDKHMAHAQHI